MGSQRPHCLVIDAHPMVRLGVRDALGAGFEIHESSSRDEAVELVRDVGSIDVAIVDLHRGGADLDGVPDGSEAIRALRRIEPSLGIVGHGTRPERHLANAALGAGATAFVSRTAPPEEMLRAVHAALDQEPFVDPSVPPKGSRGKLTRRQRQILQLLADGESTAVAARELSLSEETIKTHTKNALGRLGARNRTHAVAIALRDCLIE